jgi:hypothetical protein
MAVWEDVVTTGLIGTDRRPVPDMLPSWGAEPDHATDAEHAVLSLAARHRAVTRAGGLLPSCPQGIVAPPNREPAAGRAAHKILDRLLSPPEPDLLNLWLTAAAQHGQGATASYWTALAMVAARSSAVDRAALARALGERGVWFVEQNPRWNRLARGLRSPAQNDVPPEPDVTVAEITEDAVRADPELIMRATTPWSDQLSRTVLAIIGSGLLQHAGARYAVAVGARLPLQHYELLRAAAQQITTRAEPLSAARLRSFREAFLTLERTVWLRMEMHAAFSGEPITVDRLEIPPW